MLLLIAVGGVNEAVYTQQWGELRYQQASSAFLSMLVAMCTVTEHDMQCLMAGVAAGQAFHSLRCLKIVRVEGCDTTGHGLLGVDGHMQWFAGSSGLF